MGSTTDLLYMDGESLPVATEFMALNMGLSCYMSSERIQRAKWTIGFMLVVLDKQFSPFWASTGMKAWFICPMTTSLIQVD